MPLIRIVTSAPPLASRARSELLRDLSQTLASLLHKPEAYVMTCLEPQAHMTFAGTEEPACYAELKNMGSLPPELTAELSRVLCSKLSQALGVPQNRMFIEFTEVEAHLFGFNGETL